MEIKRRQIGSKGMFYVENDGNIQAQMVYHTTSPTHLVIEHTEVDDELRGQNVGYQLVHAAVEYARQSNIKLTVWCPFAKSVFEKKPEWNDVLNK
ncbi:MAG TPA: GNAT family N-acetyltransferase [Chitinophagaceae bacterium]|jgi:hypothetical protein